MIEELGFGFFLGWQISQFTTPIIITFLYQISNKKKMHYVFPKGVHIFVIPSTYLCDQYIMMVWTCDIFSQFN